MASAERRVGGLERGCRLDENGRKAASSSARGAPGHEDAPVLGGRAGKGDAAELLAEETADRVDVLVFEVDAEQVAHLVEAQARADAVKTYFTGKGMAADMFTTLGQGSDRPVANNATPDGRARNRRIEFRIAQ